MSIRYQIREAFYEEVSQLVLIVIDQLTLSRIAKEISRELHALKPPDHTVSDGSQASPGFATTYSMWQNVVISRSSFYQQPSPAPSEPLMDRNTPWLSISDTDAVQQYQLGSLALDPRSTVELFRQ